LIEHSVLVVHCCEYVHTVLSLYLENLLGLLWSVLLHTHTHIGGQLRTTMFHSQSNDTTHSQVNHTINPNHVDPRDDGRVSVQDHIGLNDDDGVQLGDGHGGSTSREVDQSRTWRSGDSPPLTYPTAETFSCWVWWIICGNWVRSRRRHDGW